MYAVIRRSNGNIEGKFGTYERAFQFLDSWVNGWLYDNPESHPDYKSHEDFEIKLV